MSGLRMATSLGTLAWEATSRWLCATWLGRIENRSSAITRDLFKYCLPAGVAGTLVAKLWTCVPFAFQRPATYASADMLCLDIFLSGAQMRSEFTTRSLALVRPLLSWAASISAGVTTTMQVRLALARTHGRLAHTLMTDSQIISATALALDVNLAQTSATGSNVTQFITRVTAWQGLATWLLTIEDGIFTRGARCVPRDLRQRRLSTGAIQNHIW